MGLEAWCNVRDTLRADRFLALAIVVLVVFLAFYEIDVALQIVEVTKEDFEVRDFEPATEACPVKLDYSPS